MNNHIIKINGQYVVIYQSSRKLIWLSLPQLTPVCRYYTRSNFVQTMDSGSLFVIDKNSVSFLTVNLMPLGLGLFKQEFLDWEPVGGVCLASVLILYDNHKINFYERSQNLKKTWTIEVMQQIKQLKSSPQEKVIGMTVKQKKNTIFLWNLQDISNKPFQQITVSQSIIKWQFYAKDMIVILTRKQFQVYFPKEDQYSLQYFVEIAHIAIDFCFLNRPKTSEHSGRRIVYPVCILCPQGKIYFYQLYDMEKRIKNSMASIIGTLQIQKNTRSIICGYENQSQQIILCAETENGKPICMTLNSNFLQKQKYQYLPQLTTKNTKLMQYCKQIICTQDYFINDRQQKIRLYRLHRIIQKEEYEYIGEFQSDNFGILGGYNFFCFSADGLVVYDKASNFDYNKKIVITDVKIPANLHLLEQRDNIAYFISGIKLYRLDINKKTFKNMGFTIKNDRFKLIEVRNQTRSILYKSGDEYLLIQYETPKNPENQSQKIIIKTIKSSQNSMISLRNNRWVQKLSNKIIFGQLNKKLEEFDLAKFFKLLTQQNILLEYEIYWTTHDGLILIIKNYIFLLEIVESSQGYSINPIKKSLNYLHCRFNPDADGVQVLDARNIVVREGNRILKLGTKLGNFVAEDPYSLPDTLLRRQLLMRKMYPPHHPKVIQYLIQLGHFGILDKLFLNLYDWIQENGQMSKLYQKIGLRFLIQSREKLPQAKPKIAWQQIQQQPVLKKLCEKILQNPSALNLQQNGGLILESQIEAMIFKQQNSRSLDSYSEVIITQFKTYETKNEGFKAMHIAYMLHSINKEQAVNILKGDKKQIDWDWVKKYSIILWNDSKNQMKAWAEQIGSNLFKVTKEPFDSLFWYTIAGKKTILIQLFKKYTFNSAQHDAIFKFLQRDFTDLKNQNAAVKNAYVLIDKKRYMHALAFFIYGQKIDQAISLCLNKLKDLNLAFLICSLVDDQTNRNKILDILMKEGDIWTKHIAYFYKNQHIDSFNCLFQQENIQITNNWSYQPKLTNFHPSLKHFAEMIQKSIPVKRQLQEQEMSKNKVQSNDIFQSFFGAESQAVVQQKQIQLKSLNPNYEWIKKQSIQYFIRNSCSILALMLDQSHHKAKRAYDLCSFMLTKQVNSTVLQLIYEMQDYVSIIDSKMSQQQDINPTVEQINKKFKEVLDNFSLSSVIKLQKSKIGQLMHYGHLGSELLQKIKSNKKIKQETVKNLQIYIEISKILLFLELQIFEQTQQFSIQFTTMLFQPEKLKQNKMKQQFWHLVKNYYDKITEVKKNKRQNLYDMFEQSLYKYTYKKPQNCHENTLYKIDVQKCVPIFLKKVFLQAIIGIINEKSQNNLYVEIINILLKIKRKLNSVLMKWSQQKCLDELQRQVKQMFNQGVVSKLKITFLSGYLNDKFESFCRGIMQIKSKIKKPFFEKQKTKITCDKVDKLDVIQIFRNKQQGLKAFVINKNQGLGMQLAILTKRAVKKLEICDSLINRNRSQDGISLIHQDNFNNMDPQFDYRSMFNNAHLPMIQKFLNGVVENRKQYDGIGIIKGSTKRTTPQYLKSLDPIPLVQNNEINCIECHHFLPIYMLGGKSVIELCSFSTNSNYNRIKCPGLGDIIKIRSYQQRVTALDSNGNLGSYSFDSKISGNNVFSLKKAGIIDFCLMTPTTYGFCTNNSIQVIDSLLHPKRQVVFKTQTNQAPIAVDYYHQTKLAICRKNDVNIYDTRMDLLSETRDLGGKAKCMSSNYKNRILVGKMDNKVRVLNISGPGSEEDYDVKCISNYRGNENLSEKHSIDDIQIMGKFAVSLNSEGIMSMFSIQ